MAAFVHNHRPAVAMWLLLASAVAFVLMGVDKRRAARGGWRISERTLWLCAILGGGLGGAAGMRLFRHKTKHWYFAVGFPLLAVAQWAVLFWSLLT